MAQYCCSWVCVCEADCACECVGCEFLYVCEFCGNTACENCGKSEDEIPPEDDWEDEENG